ncbi:hypothetical protein STRIP9103_09087 [Streptomyces ipomoeae 91-03]|uniref:Uncharacterized protein n=1 Tax=Streptomyces ipomoeae 91-03 TaxID=698759 RepID=L1L899_9ACTN|nr:hypothetical protein STRIP9103_09087 [Streptomyces ipomoeae 91-03]
MRQGARRGRARRRNGVPPHRPGLEDHPPPLDPRITADCATWSRTTDPAPARDVRSTGRRPTARHSPGIRTTLDPPSFTAPLA